MRDKNPSDTIYGLGLSGGLDSRVVLHYALKAGMNVNCFIIGDARPHFIFLSKDHKIAKNISKLYNMDSKFFFVKPFDKKNWHYHFVENCKRNPFTTPASFGTLFDKNALPQFDVLLTGLAGGESMGQSVPLNILNLDSNEATHALFKKFSRLSVFKHSEMHRSIDGVLSGEEFNQMFEKLHVFNENFDNYIEAFQSFLFNFLIQKSPKEIVPSIPTFSLFLQPEYLLLL